MKNALLFFLLILVSQYCVAQKIFYKGYIINNAGDTTKGFIEYKDWYTNPSSINFKRDSADPSAKTFTVNELKQFGIDGIDIYERHLCEISMYATDLKSLTVGISNNTEKKEVFLKTYNLSMGLKLYVYTDNLKERFFVTEETDSIPVELIFKQYYRSKDDNYIIKEEQYKQQIINLIHKYAAGNQMLLNRVKHLAYNLKPVYNLFADMTNSQHLKTTKKATLSKMKVNYFVAGGVNIYHYKGYGTSVKGTGLSPVIGMGIDIIPNKFRRDYFFRIDLTYSKTSDTIKNETVHMNLRFVNSRYLNDHAIAVSPTFNYNFYQQKQFSIFAGAGVGFSISPSSENSLNSKVYDNGILVMDDTYKEKYRLGNWMDINFQAGVKVIKKIELISGYKISGRKIGLRQAHIKILYSF